MSEGQNSAERSSPLPAHFSHSTGSPCGYKPHHPKQSAQICAHKVDTTTLAFKPKKSRPWPSVPNLSSQIAFELEIATVPIPRWSNFSEFTKFPVNSTVKHQTRTRGSFQ
ncbi:hypothetical protein Mapa_010836 [Marchantia paleacea]|nr:hypothetical protein Mapa_010836 [Marchantia paleacea]